VDSGSDLSVLGFASSPQPTEAVLPIAVLVIEAASNRIEHLAPLVPAVLAKLNHIPPKTLRKVGA
jgi:hypothetical protein